MVALSCASLAVAFAFFNFRASVEIVGEFTPLFMKQMGFAAVFIGLSPILGVLTQMVGTPLIGFLADKLRSRKLFLFISLLVLIIVTALFAVPKPPDQTCDVSTRNSSFGNHTTARNTSEGLLGDKMSYRKNSTSDEVSTGDRTELIERTANEERIKILVIILILRAILELLRRLTLTFLTVATMTHLQNDKTKFGFYVGWG